MSSAHHVLKHFYLTHVHSHQDKTTEFDDDLPFPAQLNVLCDTMTTNQMQCQATNKDERTLSIPLCPRNLEVEVTHDGQVISSHYVARLRETISSATHRQFIQKKYKWSDLVWWESISWDAFRICARKPLLAQPATRSKIVHNWLHLGAQRVKFGAGGTTLEIERCCPCLLPAGRGFYSHAAYMRRTKSMEVSIRCDDPVTQGTL